MTPAGHLYYLDGEKVPSVTGILGAIAKPGLINWAAEETWKYAIDHWDELSTLPLSERISRMSNARFDTLREATERGQEVHQQIQAYLAGGTVVPPAGLEGHVDSAIKFVEEWELDELLIETPVFSREFGYAGRPDCFASLRGYDGLWLLDWKTHAKGPFIESALQLAGYRYADFYIRPGEVGEDGQAVEHPIPKVDGAGIVHVKADEAVLYPYKADHDVAAIFGAVQQVHEFLNAPRDTWIGDALRPAPTEEEEEAA
jgi:hypothetical protein